MAHVDVPAPIAPAAPVEPAPGSAGPGPASPGAAGLAWRPTRRDAGLIGLLLLIWAGAFALRWHPHPAREPVAAPPVAATPTPAPRPIPVARAPVYRFAAPRTGDRFYTASPAEAAAVRRRPRRYRAEGAPWAVPETADGTVEVYRFYDRATRTHFYTASPAERDAVRARLRGYRYEGVAFRAYADMAEGRYTVIRFLDTRTGVHRLAADDAEAERLRSGQEGRSWREEGPAFVVDRPQAGD